MRAMKTPTPLVDEEYITLRDLAERLRCSRNTIRRHLREGGVKAILLGSGRNATVRYVRREVDDFLRRNRA
jgi:excisionase family DNA binding protein